MNIKYEVESISSSLEDVIGKIDRLSTSLKEFEDNLFPENYVPTDRDIESYVYSYPEHKRSIEMHTQLLEKYLKEIDDLSGKLIKVNRVLWQEKTDTSHNTLASDEVPAQND